jgi:hypothetical protein
MRFRLLVALLFSFIANALFSAPIVSEKALMAYNRYANSYVVLADSNTYYTYQLKAQKWEKHQYILDANLSFEELSNEYYMLPVSKARVYLIHNGCGIVLELYKGRLQRIDHSFAHRNQFGAVAYVFKGKPYMFGGYGFFETKNVHTSFLPSIGEWLEVDEYSKQRPSPRQGSFIVREKSQIYLIGGHTEDHPQKLNFIPEIWRYSIRQKRWTLLGDLTPTWRTALANTNQTTPIGSYLINSGDEVWELDAKRNRVRRYKQPFYFSVRKWLVSKDRKWVLMAIDGSNSLGFELRVKQKAKVLGSPLQVDKMYIKASWYKLLSYQDLFYASLLLPLFILGLWFYSKRSWKPIRFLPNSNKLQEKDFDATEWRFLQELQKQGQLELSAVHTYMNEAGLSYDALKKRRETFLKNLRIKIALVAHLQIDSVLMEVRHPQDRRVKIVVWNEELELG